MLDWESVEKLAEARYRAAIVEAVRLDAFNAVTAFAELLRERVSTFIAYNNLDDRRVVTIRGIAAHLPGYLNGRDSGAIVRMNPTTDEYVVRLGGYFTVCPPGEEFVPQ
jgi:hypothetical protein